MHRLKRLNVVKIVLDDISRDKLIAQGFEVVLDKNEINYSTFTVEKLREFAKEKNIESYSTMKKEELIAALESVENVR